MMDELDSFKNAWKSMAEIRTKEEFSAEEIKKLVTGRSNNELSKIRRKIIVEWAMAIMLSLFLVLFVYFVNPKDAPYALLLVLIILSISFVPYIKVIRLKYSSHADLKTYLSLFLYRFEKLIKQYIQMAAILVPIAGVGGFLLGLHSVANIEGQAEILGVMDLLIAILVVMVVSISGFWLQKRYFTWIYGKNIQRLRNCLKDLEEAETHE
jgi:hypothetical protein